MSNRVDKEREAALQPQRMQTAKQAIRNLGYAIKFEDETTLRFMYKGSEVSFYPYSGWASGKTITDGRGIEHLLSQIKFR